MSQEATAEQLALDPATSPQVLYELAGSNPEVRPLIAGNPNAYPALLDWLGSLGDPSINAVLAVRGVATAPAADPVPVEAEVEVETVADMHTDVTELIAASEEDTEVVQSEMVVAEPLDRVADPVDDSALQESSAGETEVLDPVLQADLEQERYMWTEAELLAAGSEPVTSVTEPLAQPAAETVAAPIPPSFQPPQSVSWQQPPAAFQDYPVQPESPKSNAGKTAIYLLLALLSVVVVALVGYLFLSGRNDSEVEADPDETVVEEVQPAPEEEAPATPDVPEEEPAEPEEVPQILFPAPAGAASSSSFLSPSENIACQIGEDQTLCTIFSQDYVQAGFPSCPDGPTTLSVTETGVSLACDAAPVSAQGVQGVLPYNSSTTSQDYACTSTQDGVSCWNILSGQSFALARGGWTGGNSGQISPGQFPW